MGILGSQVACLRSRPTLWTDAAPGMGRAAKAPRSRNPTHRTADYERVLGLPKHSFIRLVLKLMSLNFLMYNHFASHPLFVAEPKRNFQCVSKTLKMA